MLSKSLLSFLCSVFWFAVPAAGQELPFVRGDVNQDARVDLGDALSILFLPHSAAELPCEKAADVDDSGSIDISDVVSLIEFVFRDGVPPADPFAVCGLDPTEDALSCGTLGCGASSGLRISEFMASNSGGLVDEDDEETDWIELAMDDGGPFAVDLSGWYLTDDPGLLTAWRFPVGVSIEPGQPLVVFASGKDRAGPGDPLHTSFQLQRNGEYLALVAPDGITVVDAFAPYPEQLTNVSYGRVRATLPLVPPRAVVEYRVPTEADAELGLAWASRAFDAAGWLSGPGGLGFNAPIVSGFRVQLIEAAVEVSDIETAIEVLDDPAKQARVFEETATVIDYLNSGDSGNYPGDNPFPGVGLVPADDFVVHAEGKIVIPSAGAWSFGVSSDDGFRLTIQSSDGSSAPMVMEHASPRAAGNTVSTFSIVNPGPHDVRLVYFQRTGGAEVELFAADRAVFGTFQPEYFRLIGDTEAGGLGFQDFGPDIGTDVREHMEGVNASIWQRVAFQVEAVDDLNRLVLDVKYEDGFAAYINGRQVARRNAPGVLSWNSVAASDRPSESALVAESIDISHLTSFLENGSNVLAVHGLNDGVDDGGFLISATLSAKATTPQLHYMSEPTPGSDNVPGAVDFLTPVEFSVRRGFYDSPFSLALTHPNGEAQIRYTLDGSEPTSSEGVLYESEIPISGTQVVRAFAFQAFHIDSTVTAHTYLFVDDVVLQSSTGEPPGPGWPSGAVNGQTLDYGMDPDIVESARWSPLIRGALRAIPAISLSTDLDNLFGSARGIYVNARNDGRAWERPVSVELLQTDGSEGFGVNAGLRIRGAFSRNRGNPKHSFRLFFRRQYGDGKLRFALFGGEGASAFDKVDLRTSQNYSWAAGGSEKNTLQREVFSRDAQRDMGQPYTRSRYYHLYINAVYWGVFQTQERADADFAASYLGGTEEEYDVIKNDSSGNRALQATAGTIAAYHRLYDAAVDGFGTDEAYFRVQGMLPDGTPDANGEALLDPANLMDYMACTYYTGDPDAPVSVWGHIANNVFAVYNRENPSGFRWFRHDAEHSLGANGGLNEGRLLTNSVDRTIGSTRDQFNPAWLHLRLTEHPEYRLRFADRVQQYFYGNGILSPAGNLQRWAERHLQLENAIIGASARWGDASRATPRTRDDWQAESDWLTNTFFPARTDIVLNQMRSVGMFPEVAIVSLSQHGGEVSSGFQLSLSQANGTSGTVWYTVDGSDPRLWGGEVAPSALLYDESDPAAPLTIEATTTVRARVQAGGDWGAMADARFTVGLSGLVINEVMASNATTLEDPIEPGEFPDWIEFYNGTLAPIELGGMYVTDDPLDLQHWQFAEGIRIDPGEYLLVFADDDGSTHPLHTNFQLSMSGETVMLVDRDGKTVIDSIVFDAQATDVSFGRSPDGGASWGPHVSATPGAANAPHDS